VNAELNVGLFDNERESNLASTVAMVEAALRELGHVVDRARIASPGAQRAWRFVNGSAEVAITIFECDGGWHLRVAAAVLTMDDQVDALALYHRLLVLNGETIVGAAFAVRGPHVILHCERSTRDLDQSEVDDMLRRVQTYADTWDDKLVAEFGGTLGAPE
jgi:hypothetical protein